VLGSERLTGALLDRLTHHVSILTNVTTAPSLACFYSATLAWNPTAVDTPFYTALYSP